jgi:hypothetical protein
MTIIRPGFPAHRIMLRRSLARRDVCPECGGALDTGWECNDCGYDAKTEATTAAPPGVISAEHLKAEAKRHRGKRGPSLRAITAGETTTKGNKK